MPGQHLAFEYCLVGEIGRLCKSQYIGDAGPGTRGNHNAPRPKNAIARFNAVGITEFGRLLDYLDTKPFKPLHRVMGLNGGNHAMDVGMHFPEIGFWFCHASPVFRSIAHVMRPPRAGNERF